MTTARTYFAVVLGTLVLHAPLAMAQGTSDDEAPLDAVPPATTDAAPSDRNTLRFGAEAVQLDSATYYLSFTGSYARHFAGRFETLEVGVVVVPGLLVGMEEGEPEGVYGRRVTEYGHATATLRVHESVRLRLNLALGASYDGFMIGGGGQVILGAPSATFVEVGGDYLLDLGYVVRTHVGFNARPRMPMGATVEVTSFPLVDEPSARLLVDVAFRSSPGTYLKFVAGYRIGPYAYGFCLGIETATSF